MNKRQKLMLSLAKCQHKAMECNSNYHQSFRRHYIMTKWAYKHETNEEIRRLITWTRKQYKE